LPPTTKAVEDIEVGDVEPAALGEPQPRRVVQFEKGAVALLDGPRPPARAHGTGSVHAAAGLGLAQHPAGQALGYYCRESMCGAVEDAPASRELGEEAADRRDVERPPEPRRAKRAGQAPLPPRVVVAI
jgi:hypothetical protein